MLDVAISVIDYGRIQFTHVSDQSVSDFISNGIYTRFWLKQKTKQWEHYLPACAYSHNRLGKRVDLIIK